VEEVVTKNKFSIHSFLFQIGKSRGRKWISAHQMLGRGGEKE
jgi:hypothetical protein